jgi:hypothetical protein
MTDLLIISDDLTPDPAIVKRAKAFLDRFKSYETRNRSGVMLHFDKKSKAYYIQCHLDGRTLKSYCDLEATLDGSKEDEIYKLNREITEDQAAYKAMEQDAIEGRSFEDLVIEYDTSYRDARPLKVYGGQHRIRAIAKAVNSKVNEFHGARVYIDLSLEQKVEIATVNNTSIAVSNDLLDRMREQMIGSELRDWCQSVGLLGEGEGFADRRSALIPTVRIVRTIIVNFYRGMEASDDDLHQPIICKSGGMDEDYLKVRGKVTWSDEALITMGQQFVRLHELQRETVVGREKDSYAEFARKALSLSVVASWAYAAGLFQRQIEHLQNHYALPDIASPPDDPLNAKALSEARLKGTDPDTYRGLGTRSNTRELGRMLEVFLVQATRASKRGITKALANAAIQSYEAKRATYNANKALGRI